MFHAIIRRLLIHPHSPTSGQDSPASDQIRAAFWMLRQAESQPCFITPCRASTRAPVTCKLVFVVFWKESDKVSVLARYCSRDIAHETLLSRYCSQDTAHETLRTRHCSQGTIHEILFVRYCSQNTVHKKLLNAFLNCMDAQLIMDAVGYGGLLI